MNEFNEPLAHSERILKGIPIPSQSYRHHIENVEAKARANADAAAKFCTNGFCSTFVESVAAAALCHDLGKLDKENQTALEKIKKQSRHLPVNHVDAGVALLWSQKRIESAVLVYGHHYGLLSKPEESKKPNELFLRDPELKDKTDESLYEYIRLHKQIAPVCGHLDKPFSSWSGLSRRIGLSCLVDADHGDTARHYQKESLVAMSELRWVDRLKALDIYVAGLGKEGDEQRNKLRSEIYCSCRNAFGSPSIRACDSPVGTGKTTAVIAHLLRVAIEKKLRHVIVVLPYTNIIKQSVDTYRKALVLPGEDPETIIAEHHHQADFSDETCRHLATLWNAPVIVTTAVQFFETLAAFYPSRLRKLHELPGSAVFIDEVHAAIPVWQWPQQWLWIEELSRNWSCHFVFASGSLAKFWKFDSFVSPRIELPDIVTDDIRLKAQRMEIRRISYVKRREKPFNRKELIERIVSERGPRLVILNTVQSAAVMANEIKRAGHDVLHVSTALAPIDRNRIVEQVKTRLKKENNWTLVSTSCVEAGMDFSFATAFRESCSMANLIQTGGRVNRHGEKCEGKVIDFRVMDELLNEHKAFNSSRKVLDDILENNNIFLNLSLSDSITLAMENELKIQDVSEKIRHIKEAEKKMDYPETAKLCRVIDSDTRMVVVYPEIVKKIEAGEHVNPQELVKKSVQMYCDKIRKLSLEPIKNGYLEIFKLGNYKYDRNFLGYMEGFLPLVYAKENYCFFA